jgi:hypothetical protein
MVGSSFAFVHHQNVTLLQTHFKGSPRPHYAPLSPFIVLAHHPSLRAAVKMSLEKMRHSRGRGKE